jgi:hypothetical protein
MTERTQLPQFPQKGQAKQRLYPRGSGDASVAPGASAPYIE